MLACSLPLREGRGCVSRRPVSFPHWLARRGHPGVIVDEVNSLGATGKHKATTLQLMVTEAVTSQRVHGWARPGISPESGGEEASHAPVWGAEWERRRHFQSLGYSVLHPVGHSNSDQRAEVYPSCLTRGTVKRTFTRAQGQTLTVARAKRTPGLRSLSRSLMPASRREVPGRSGTGGFLALGDTEEPVSPQQQPMTTSDTTRCEGRYRGF